MSAMANPCRMGRWLSRAVLASAFALVAAAASAAISLPEQKDRLAEIGRQHRTASDLYKDFEKQANGGQKLDVAQMPDWTGIYTRGGIIFNFDPDQGRGSPTAKLTPEYEKRLKDKLDKKARGIEFDYLRNCAPPGVPRWLTEPFLREFVVTPGQTLLINEMVWQRVDDKTVIAHVWVYDPPSLGEPWYAKQTYTKLSDDDKRLRIRYWDCGENQNNTVIQTDNGSSQFRDFTFDK
jgi:hypothetical protein